MSQINLDQITQLTAQLQALNSQISVTTDPTVKALLQSQANVITQQLQAAAAHAQANVDSTNNLLDGLGLFATLNSALGGMAQNLPNILSLFKK